MATISRAETKGRRRFFGIQFKYLLTYLALIAVVIVVLNTYPVTISRDLVFISKQNTILSQALQISTAVEALEKMTPETVSQVMSMLETGELSRVAILNMNLDELYSDSNNTAGYEESILFNMMHTATGGVSDEFESFFSDGAFRCYAAVPIVSGGSVIGAVCIYEYDEAEGAIILGLRADLIRISAALSMIAILMSLIFSRTFSSRIRKILDAIVNVREGEYTYRIDVSGHDELAQLSDEFNSLTGRLQHTEELRRRFVADASHELKTPLAAIRLLSDSILQTDNMDDETVKEFVGGIREESERLARTTGQLLDLTKLDNNTTTVRTNVDCGAVGESVVRTLRPIAEVSRVTVRTDFDPECHIMASQDELFQIIYNLAENAIKYNYEGGRVAIRIKKQGECVNILVEDTGIGIPAQDMPYIFDRFYRVDKSRGRDSGGGTGLGLSIVKSTAERHGGEVTAERIPGGGMRFIVSFPAYAAGTKSL